MFKRNAKDIFYEYGYRTVWELVKLLQEKIRYFRNVSIVRYGLLERTLFRGHCTTLIIISKHPDVPTIAAHVFIVMFVILFYGCHPCYQSRSLYVTTYVITHMYAYIWKTSFYRFIIFVNSHSTLIILSKRKTKEQ